MTAQSLFSHLEPELSVKAALLGMVALQGLDNETEVLQNCNSDVHE